MKAKFLTIVLAVCLLSTAAFGQGFSLESVDGLFRTSTDSITADGATQVVFNFRIITDANSYTGLTNGFRVYSPDGATWGSTVPDHHFDWQAYANMTIWTVVAPNNDGALADTVGFGGLSLTPGVGVPANTDTVSYRITIGPIPAGVDNHGKQLCVDSSWYPASGTWKWGGSGGLSVFPSWDGPHCFTVVDPTLDVQAVEGTGLPTSFGLRQNYPNPFNPSTEIMFDVPKRAQINISVYNVLGQKVRTLVDEKVDAGVKRVEWDGTNDGGVSVASGIYFYRMEADAFVATKKMMMLK